GRLRSRFGGHVQGSRLKALAVILLMAFQLPDHKIGRRSLDMKLHYLLAPALLAWSPALAADTVHVSEEPLPVSSTFDWTGGYIGLNIGGGFGEFEHPFSNVTTAAPPTSVLDGSLDITAGGFLGGAQ